MESDASSGSDSPSALTAFTLNLYSWPEIEFKYHIKGVLVRYVI